MDNRIIKKIPMTKQQESVYFSSISDKKTIAYNLPMSAEFDANTDIQLLKNSFERFLERHDAFRTAFIEENGKMYQVLYEKTEYDITVEEISDERLEKRFTEFVRYFNLDCAPLARALIIKTETKTVMFMDFHHIIFDGISSQIMERELTQLINDPDAKLPDAGSYFDYSERVAGEDLSQAKDDILASLDGFEIPEPVPSDMKRPDIRSFEGSRIYMTCPQKTASNVTTLCRKFRVTDNMLLIAACLITLSRFSFSENIVIGTPVMNRLSEQDMDTVGMFVNTAIVSEQVRNSESVVSFIEKVKESFISVLKYQSYPFSDLVHDLGIRSEQSRNPVFDVLFEMLGDEKQRVFKNGYKRTETGRALFDITFRIFKGKNEYELELEYCTKLYNRSTAEKIAETFWYIFEQLSDADTIGDIRMISPEVEKKCSNGFRYRELAFEGRTVTSMWKDIVSGNSEKTAVVDGDKKLSYMQLDRAAARLAAYMKVSGAVKGDFIGVYGTRCADVLVSLLAIIKSGCVYLPVDETYPDDRVSFIFSDCSPRIILDLTNKDTVKSFYNGDAVVISPYAVECNGYDNEIWHDVITDPDDLMYCIYTSGTTGNPKGVLDPQRTILNVILNEYEDGSDIFAVDTAMTTSIGFDVFLQETLSTLLAGGTIHVIPDLMKKDSDSFAGYILENNIRNIFCTPSYFDVLTSDISYATAVLNTLKNVFLAGEKFFLNKICLDYAAENKVIFHNDYGPTETHVVTSGVMMNNCNSIGTPLANVKAYVFNGNQLLGEGMPGELCIGGIPVAHGYHKNPERSRQVFIKDRYNGGVMYRTGDLVRFMPDGNIEFLGRIDDQVKIRGFRIEPEEIAAAIRDIDEIDDGAVIAEKDSTGQMALFAYIISRVQVNIAYLRNELSKRLPDYMVPNYIMQLDSFPLNHNGKLNKRALPKPTDFSAAEVVKPENRLEQKICDIFSEILKMSAFSATDSFYDHGGDSLKAMKVVSALKKHGYRTEVRDIMKYPTPRGLAGYLAVQNDIEVTGHDYRVVFNVNLKLRNRYVIGLTKEYDSNISRKSETGYNGLVLQKYILGIKAEKYDFIQGHMTCANTIKIVGNVSDEQVITAARKLIGEQSVFRTSATIKGYYTEHSADGWIIPWIDLTKEEISYDELSEAFECLNNDLQYVSPPHMLSKLFVVKIQENNYEIRYFIHHSLFDGMSHKAVAGRIKALLNSEPPRGIIEPYSEYVKKCRRKAKTAPLSRKLRIRKNIMIKTLAQVTNSLFRKKKEFYVDVMIKANEGYMSRFIADPLEECAKLYYSVNYGKKSFKAPFLLFLNQRDHDNVENCGMYFDVVPVVYDPKTDRIENSEGDFDYKNVEKYFRYTEVFDLMTVITASQLVPLINYLGVFNGNVFNAKIPDSDLDIRVSKFDSNRLKREKRMTCYTLKNWIYINCIISGKDKNDVRKKIQKYFAQMI